MCSRGPVQHSREHGGGWESGDDRFRKLAPEGARVRLAPGVEAWFVRGLAKVDLVAGAHPVQLDVDLEASKISAQPGAGKAHPDAKLLLDLAVAARDDAGCAAP